MSKDQLLEPHKGSLQRLRVCLTDPLNQSTGLGGSFRGQILSHLSRNQRKRRNYLKKDLWIQFLSYGENPCGIHMKPIGFIRILYQHRHHCLYFKGQREGKMKESYQTLNFYCTVQEYSSTNIRLVMGLRQITQGYLMNPHLSHQPLKVENVPCLQSDRWNRKYQRDLSMRRTQPAIVRENHMEIIRRVWVKF